MSDEAKRATAESADTTAIFADGEPTCVDLPVRGGSETEGEDSAGASLGDETERLAASPNAGPDSNSPADAVEQSGLPSFVQRYIDLHGGVDPYEDKQVEVDEEGLERVMKALNRREARDRAGPQRTSPHSDGGSNVAYAGRARPPRALALEDPTGKVVVARPQAARPNPFEAAAPTVVGVSRRQRRARTTALRWAALGGTAALIGVASVFFGVIGRSPATSRVDRVPAGTEASSGDVTGGGAHGTAALPSSAVAAAAAPAFPVRPGTPSSAAASGVPTVPTGSGRLRGTEVVGGASRGVRPGSERKASSNPSAKPSSADPNTTDDAGQRYNQEP